MTPDIGRASDPDYFCDVGRIGYKQVDIAALAHFRIWIKGGDRLPFEKYGTDVGFRQSFGQRSDGFVHCPAPVAD